jgi:hypothetical protein
MITGKDLTSKEDKMSKKQVIRQINEIRARISADEMEDFVDIIFKFVM